MNESRSISLLVDPLEVDDESRRVVFREGEDLGAKQRDDVVRDDFRGLIYKISVIDSQMVIKPHDFIRY